MVAHKCRKRVEKRFGLVFFKVLELIAKNVDCLLGPLLVEHLTHRIDLDVLSADEPVKRDGVFLWLQQVNQLSLADYL